MKLEHLGGVLFFGAVVAACVLQLAHVQYGWGVMAVFVAFVAGGLILANSD